MVEFTIWDILRGLVLAARWTVLLSLVAFVCGGMVGLIAMFMRTSKSRTLQFIARAYIEIFQGTPLLMQLFLAFFGLALFGWNVTAGMAASIALILWTGAFLAEIWRGCVESIGRGQWEASASLAMNRWEQMRHIILPQALRVAIAPTVGFSVQVIKVTAQTSIIGFVDLMKASTMIVNATFQPFTVYGLAALIYFVLCWPLSKGSQALERKLNAAHRS